MISIHQFRGPHNEMERSSPASWPPHAPPAFPMHLLPLDTYVLRNPGILEHLLLWALWDSLGEVTETHRTGQPCSLGP